MPDGGEDTRLIGVCSACESIHTCVLLSDGTIRPIGSYECPCGCREFEAFDESTAEGE
ncbi:hypothetical protein [Halovivax gelatinilyticus]|uniref:hypothetical protein n=1 Tax=Halovivax gelatinilyticus TaxID=2961597 RepID=UPI0020CA5ADD|nr:hypothetical protein [Halovivax gelatinilyticus]